MELKTAPEIWLMIAENLQNNPEDLNHLVQTSKRHLKLLRPILYQQVYITIFNKQSQPTETLKLLMTDTSLAARVRDIEINGSGFGDENITLSGRRKRKSKATVKAFLYLLDALKKMTSLQTCTIGNQFFETAYQQDQFVEALRNRDKPLEALGFSSFHPPISGRPFNLPGLKFLKWYGGANTWYNDGVAMLYALSSCESTLQHLFIPLPLTSDEDPFWTFRFPNLSTLGLHSSDPLKLYDLGANVTDFFLAHCDTLKIIPIKVEYQHPSLMIDGLVEVVTYNMAFARSETMPLDANPQSSLTLRKLAADIDVIEDSLKNQPSFFNGLEELEVSSTVVHLAGNDIIAPSKRVLDLVHELAAEKITRGSNFHLQKLGIFLDYSCSNFCCQCEGPDLHSSFEPEDTIHLLEEVSKLCGPTLEVLFGLIPTDLKYDDSERIDAYLPVESFSSVLSLFPRLHTVTLNYLPYNDLGELRSDTTHSYVHSMALRSPGLKFVTFHRENVGTIIARIERGDEEADIRITCTEEFRAFESEDSDGSSEKNGFIPGPE